MAIELKIPTVGESITEVEIGEWKVTVGQQVNVDTPLVELETDKASVEVPAPVSGTITKILKGAGDTADIGEVIGYMEEGEVAVSGEEAPSAPPEEKPAPKKPAEAKSADNGAPARAAASAPAAPVRESGPEEKEREVINAAEAPHPTQQGADDSARIMPAAQRLMDEHDVALEDIEATGPGGRVLKEDVMRVIKDRPRQPAAPSEVQVGAEPPHTAAHGSEPRRAPVSLGFRTERVMPMTPMRRTIAARLVSAQQTAALLTTFNEIDMSSVLALRDRHRDEFLERYGIKLGLMSFFVKAVVDALRRFPEVNAEIRDTNIVYHDFYDIGIAIGAGKGLVVPVLRDADHMTFRDIEQAIADFAVRAKENRIKLEELEGGTFTISNGGVYGSLLSTPIVNPPQSGILGMHAIQERPIAVDGQVVIRPMMYIALTYDHRLVDGREAVTFLKTIKHTIEDPGWMLVST